MKAGHLSVLFTVVFPACPLFWLKYSTNIVEGMIALSVIHLGKDSDVPYIVSISLPSKHVPQYPPFFFLPYLVLVIPKVGKSKAQDSTR